MLNAHLVNMARAGLRLPLRTALHQAVATHQRVVQERVQVQTNGDVQTLTLVVEPRPELGDDVPLYMVLFQDVGGAESRASGGASVTPGPEDVHLRALEHELQATQERLSATIEELVTTNEELSSANEEFQSANEELETSKEELQSLNEELETVNAELRRKVDELDRANSDLRNLLDSTQIATIFLDAELCIKNFTPPSAPWCRFVPAISAGPSPTSPNALSTSTWWARLGTCSARLAGGSGPCARLTATAATSCALGPIARWPTSLTASSSPLPT
jgi:two-component system, chemotaxis family, CheB/CheR fusion protein